MLKLSKVTKVKVFFLVLVYVFNFNLFEFLGTFGEGSVERLAWFVELYLRLKLLMCSNHCLMHGHSY